MVTSLLDLAHQQSMHSASLKAVSQDTIPWDPDTSPWPPSSSTLKPPFWSEVVCRKKKGFNRDDLVLTNRFEALSAVTLDEDLAATLPNGGPVATGDKGLATGSAQPAAPPVRARTEKLDRRSSSSSVKRRQLIRDAVGGHGSHHCFKTGAWSREGPGPWHVRLRPRRRLLELPHHLLRPLQESLALRLSLLFRPPVMIWQLKSQQWSLETTSYAMSV